MTKKIGSNPAQIPWPTDKWGFTRELRKAVATAASRVKGDQNKKEILDETLKVALGFLEISFKDGVKTRKRLLSDLAKADKETGERREAGVVKTQNTERDLFDIND